MNIKIKIIMLLVVIALIFSGCTAKANQKQLENKIAGEILSVQFTESYGDVWEYNIYKFKDNNNTCYISSVGSTHGHSISCVKGD